MKNIFTDCKMLSPPSVLQSEFVEHVCYILHETGQIKLNKLVYLFVCLFLCSVFFVFSHLQVRCNKNNNYISASRQSQRWIKKRLRTRI